MTKVRLLHFNYRILPGKQFDTVWICQDVCDEKGNRITCKAGRYECVDRVRDIWNYYESKEEKTTKEKLQRALGPQYLIKGYGCGQGRMRFEAILAVELPTFERGVEFMVDL